MAESRSPGGDRAGFLVARLCPMCGLQQGNTGVATHRGDCLNLGKTFAPHEVEVVSAVWREVAEELAEAVAYFKEKERDLLADLEDAGRGYIAARGVLADRRLAAQAALARFDALSAGAEQ